MMVHQLMYPPAHLVRASSSRQRERACCITDPPGRHNEYDEHYNY